MLGERERERERERAGCVVRWIAFSGTSLGCVESSSMSMVGVFFSQEQHRKLGSEKKERHRGFGGVSIANQ